MSSNGSTAKIAEQAPKHSRNVDDALCRDACRRALRWMGSVSGRLIVYPKPSADASTRIMHSRVSREWRSHHDDERVSHKEVMSCSASSMCIGSGSVVSSGILFTKESMGRVSADARGQIDRKKPMRPETDMRSRGVADFVDAISAARAQTFVALSVGQRTRVCVACNCMCKPK